MNHHREIVATGKCILCLRAMKPLLLSLGLLWGAVCARAQPTQPEPFSAYAKKFVPSASQELAWPALVQSGQMAQLTLNSRINGSNQLLVVAWGRDFALINDGTYKIKSLAEIKALYDGRAIVPSTPISSVVIEDAARVVPFKVAGPNAENTFVYTLRNTGKTPVDIVAGTASCQCASFKLERNHLEPNQTTRFTLTVRTDLYFSMQSMVRVALETNEDTQPRLMVAVQPAQTYPPFQLPPSLSLMGEKGYVLNDTVGFELPVGWKVAGTTSTLDWLQTKVQPSVQNDPKYTGLPRFTLTATAPNSAPPGLIEGQVRLQLQGGPLESVIVPLTGYISDDVAISPRMVVVNNSPIGVARRFVVVHGPRPFTIRGITANVPGFQAHCEPTLDSRAYAVELLVPISGPKGDFFSKHIVVTLSDGRVLPLDVVGTIGEGQFPATAQNLALNAPAPNFAGTDSQERAISLADYKGSNLLLTFFPRCFTKDCQSQLTSLRDELSGIEATGTRVLAVSTDTPAQMRDFSKRIQLNFPVFNDQSRQVSLAFGAVQNATDTPARLSVLIDREGKVRWIDTDVRVLTHGTDMLAKIHELGLAR